MKQVVQHIGSRKLEVAEVPEPACKGGGVVVRNTVSLISAGTERLVIDFANKSLLGKAQERPDLVKKVLDKVRKEGIGATLQTVKGGLERFIPLGYSCAGVVEQVGRGAEEFAVGDRVACAGMGYASHAHAVFVPRNLTVAVPANVTLEDASYVTLGAIALQGVRIADVRLGESVAVIGLGLLGQLTVQILRANGCRVIGVDLDPAKVEQAVGLGAEAAVRRSDDVLAAVAAFTDGVGVDAVVVTAATDSNDPIELAGELCRDRGRVSMVGAVKMDVPRKVYYMKELELRLSRSYGPGRYDPSYEEEGRDYPVGYVRWTERRNMQEFLRLVSTGQVTPSALTTHRFPVEQAEEAYDIVTGKRRENFAGVVLTYEQEPSAASRRTLRLPARAARTGAIGLGFIGAGNFATSVLLPRFSRVAGADLVGVATATGVSAKNTGSRFGFRYATTDMAELLADPAVHAVVIATRHASHAHFAAQALRAGKAVFVEKPLAIDEAGLEEVLAAQAESGQVLAVGFNRRFSPLAEQLKAFFAPGSRLAVTYRVNAGAIPKESWIHDPEEGGGRIIGEVCHFVDLLQFLTDDLPVEVFAHSLGGPEGALHDTIAATLRFRNGSLASINYLATGDRAHPKEHVEVFGGGGIGILEDFREVLTTRGGKRTRTRKLAQEKGFDQEIARFLDAVREGGSLPISIESLEATHRVTYALEESLRTGAPVGVAT